MKVYLFDFFCTETKVCSLSALSFQQPLSVPLIVSTVCVQIAREVRLLVSIGEKMIRVRLRTASDWKGEKHRESM